MRELLIRFGMLVATVAALTWAAAGLFLSAAVIAGNPHQVAVVHWGGRHIGFDFVDLQEEAACRLASSP